MKAKFIPFALLFALALGFAAACTASLGAEGGGYGLEGEVVLGERGDAPVTLRAEAVLSGKAASHGGLRRRERQIRRRPELGRGRPSVH